MTIESLRIKRQSKPKPFSENHQLQRKVLETSMHTLKHSEPPTATHHTHILGHVEKEAAEKPKPKKQKNKKKTNKKINKMKIVRQSCPQQRIKQFYIADRNKELKYTRSHDGILVQVQTAHS